ncbi:DUF3016 domain-containing protein [Pseudomonas cavernae]|uniref:DUF3016 domain-containing protein n=1 Tax=Pseudomonas cavernae TaxID=2320867 RepID=A0A385Z225_9PSED|nr:DUF3016 domain-containing protein [Pseudomonas cavernae]AYC32804.1 DUF3016 domain-containing protein [Pseudomonas cavernae]
MRRAITCAAIALVALSGMPRPLAAASAVDVSFMNPESFRDASLKGSGYGAGADEFVLKELRSRFEQLGARYLQPGQTLQIEVRDIDLAGRYEPWRVNASHVRFMLDITWPSIDLHYVLKQNDQQIASEDARVSDMFYLQRPGRANSSDRLYAEKAMLGEWFRAQFDKQHLSATP